MALELTADQESSEAFAEGANRGYDHANYALAYDPDMMEYLPTVPNRHDAYHVEYLAGFDEGKDQSVRDHAGLGVKQ